MADDMEGEWLEVEAPTRGLRSLGRRYEVSGFRSKVSGTHAHIRGATRS